MTFLNSRLFYALVVVLVLTAIQSSVLAQTRIRFTKGRTSSTVSGRIAKDSSKCFVLGTKEGQFLDAVLRSPSNKIQFPFAFGAGPEKGGKSYSKTTGDGDEKVCIENYGNAATFSLTISIR